MSEKLFALVEDDDGFDYLYEYEADDVTEYDDEPGVEYLEIEGGFEVALGEEEEIDEDEFEEV